jgi:uncharacterized repeat protein (TIGR03803 family)
MIVSRLRRANSFLDLAFIRVLRFGGVIMNYKKFLRAASVALMVVIVLTLALAPGAWAQGKYKTLHSFASCNRGCNPLGGLTFDQAGNLYGTTEYGGALSQGAVFKLTPNKDGSWSESILYSFTGGSDGGFPVAGLIFDQAGNLYGTAWWGGAYNGGVAFRLAPNLDGSWTESVLYGFTRGQDGGSPYAGLIFDAVGNLYGTTWVGGFGCNAGCGVVFELTPNSDGSWTESVLHSFCSLKNCADGGLPLAGLIFDQAGNLYGTTAWYGAYGGGVVFRLTRNPDGSWTESVLHTFSRGSDGGNPYAGVILDQVGNLYGTTEYGGFIPNVGGCTEIGCGVVFRLTPNSNGGWKEKVLHQFTDGRDGGNPVAGLIFDQAGNLYGTTESGGGEFRYGVVFELAPNSNGGWKERLLWAFEDNPGALPDAGLVFDAAGNLYSTTIGDGTKTFGSVFEITP